MKSVKSASNYLRTILLTLLAGPMAVGLLSYSPDAAAISCSRTVTANVVALDQPGDVQPTRSAERQLHGKSVRNS